MEGEVSLAPGLFPVVRSVARCMCSRPLRLLSWLLHIPARQPRARSLHSTPAHTLLRTAVQGEEQMEEDGEEYEEGQGEDE